MEEMKNLSSQAIGNVHGPIYTSKEVHEYGIPYDYPPPKPETCKFCGKRLYYEGIVLMGACMAHKRAAKMRLCTSDRVLEATRCTISARRKATQRAGSTKPYAGEN